jgi:hypothetical protein
MPREPCTYFSHCFLLIEVTRLFMYKSTMIFFLSLSLKTITSLKYSWSMCQYYFMMYFHTLVNSFPIQPSNTSPSYNSPIHLTSFKMSNFFSLLHFSTCSKKFVCSYSSWIILSIIFDASNTMVSCFSILTILE